MIVNFAGELAAALPRPSSSSMVGETYSLTAEQLERVAVVVNTAEYCSTTVPQLTDLIKSTIDKAFADHVKMEAAEDALMDTIAAAMKVLVRATGGRGLLVLLGAHVCVPMLLMPQSHGMACTCDAQLVKMSKTKWDSTTEAGDQSGTMRGRGGHS